MVKTRRLYSLRYDRQVANENGIGRTTVTNRLSSARKLIKKNFNEFGERR